MYCIPVFFSINSLSNFRISGILEEPIVAVPDFFHPAFTVSACIAKNVN